MTLTWLSWTSTFQKNKRPINAKIYLLTAICAFFLMPSIALAQQPLIFSSAQSYKDHQILKFVGALREKENIPRILSRVDLNDDGIYEYLVKPLNCNANRMCLHHVVAFKDHRPILLLDIDAYKIAPSDKKTYGVSDLIIHNQKHNDFLFKNYGWNPFSNRYEQKEF